MRARQARFAEARRRGDIGVRVRAAPAVSRGRLFISVVVTLTAVLTRGVTADLEGDYLDLFFGNTIDKCTRAGVACDLDSGRVV
jgi:hypothetical protein